MIKYIKIPSLSGTSVIFLLLLVVGCGPSSKRPAPTQVEPETTPKLAVESPQAEVKKQGEKKPQEAPELSKRQVEPEKKAPAVKLALKFTKEDLTTYRVITQAQRSIKWEGPLPDKSSFQGGTTGNRIEMSFTQQIQRVDDKGNAAARVTIKGLRCQAKVKDNITLDFDSSREKDRNNPLASLIGQSYNIKITPDGQVSKVIDVNEAKAVIKGSSLADKTALRLLMPDTIKQLHTIAALPGSDKNKQLHPGENWSSLKTLSFGMMGTKSYERIYTLKKIEDVQGRRIAVVQMSAIPSAEKADQFQQGQGMGVFAKMFDNTYTYTGQLRMDLSAGKVEKYVEKLRTEWVAVDPSAAQKADKEPAALRMTATRLYELEKID